MCISIARLLLTSGDCTLQEWAGWLGVALLSWRDRLVSVLLLILITVVWKVNHLRHLYLSQLLQRLKLNANGDPGNYKNTCTTWTALGVIYIVCLACFLLAAFWTGSPFTFLLLIPSFVLCLYAINVFVKTRHYMMRRYNIPSNKCCEILHPFVIYQMMSHTHDHKQYRYNCCSHTGLDEDAPEIREVEDPVWSAK